MKVVCLIATWRDGVLLRQACESAAPWVDAIVVLDGGYEGIVPTEDATSTDDELLAAHSLSEKVHIVQVMDACWPGEIEKRNELLDIGRGTVPREDGEDRWALVLDADEILMTGGLLAEYLAGPARLAFAPGLPRREPDGSIYWAPSRLFRLTDEVRYDRSDVLYDEEIGHHVSLEHELVSGALYARAEAAVPWVAHRWDERPPWRQEVRDRHAHTAGQRDSPHRHG